MGGGQRDVDGHGHDAHHDGHQEGGTSEEGGGGEAPGSLVEEFLMSMVTPGLLGPRLVRLLFGALGGLALVLIAVWWRAGPDVAPHAAALLALTALLAASLAWVLGELRAQQDAPPPKDHKKSGQAKKKKKKEKSNNTNADIKKKKKNRNNTNNKKSA